LVSLISALLSAGQSYYRCIPMVALMASPCCVHEDSAVVDAERTSPSFDQDDAGCCERETFSSVAPLAQSSPFEVGVPTLSLIGFAVPALPIDHRVAQLSSDPATPGSRGVAQPRAPPNGPSRSRTMVFLL
jgi:hypothetical protein